MPRALAVALLVATLAACGAAPEGGGPTTVAAGSASQERQQVPFDRLTRDEMLLGHHANLAVRFMRGTIDDRPDFVEAAVAALATNTDDLTAQIEQLHGAEAASGFRTVWTAFGDALFRYAEGVDEGNEDLKSRARADLEQVSTQLAAAVRQFSGGQLDEAVIKAELGAHVQDLLAQVEAYAAGDYGRAYQLQRQAYARMFPAAFAIVQGVPPQQQPAQSLRSALGRLLGEHVELAVEAMRSAARDQDDFQAAADALNGNTAAITEAMGTVFGPEGGAQFSDLWAQHIDGLMRYTGAVAAGDEAAKAEIRGHLEGFERRFADLLAHLSGGRIDAAAASHLLVMHDHDLIAQIEAYAREDYPTAYSIGYKVYQDSFSIAGALADAIQAQVQAQAPPGGIQTGGGGATG